MGKDPVSSDSPFNPYLYINFTTIEEKQGGMTVGMAFFLNLDLMESTNLERIPGKRVSISTWSRGTIASCSAGEFEQLSRNILKDKMDDFINDYLAANPKD